MRFWIIGILAPIFFLTGCVEHMPVWEKKIFHGNPDKQVVERTQDKEEISTKDPRFKKMVCIFTEDYICLYETYIINAKGWKKQSACGLEPTDMNPK